MILSTLALLFAQAEPVPPQLDPEQRALITMAMAGMALAGVLVLLLIVLGAWWVRRTIHRRRARPSQYAGESAPVDSLAAIVDEFRQAEVKRHDGYNAADAQRAAQANFSATDRRDLIRLRSNEPGQGPADPRAKGH